MIKLSVAIMTFNEERNIGRCLDSIKGIADEIIVVDSFSTDKTEEICKSYGVIFIKNEFKGYIEQRDFLCRQASSPYILTLDADEALSIELRLSIIEAKENWVYDTYTMNRLSNYCGKWVKYGSWYPDIKLRLLDYRSGEWAGFNPHDEFKLIDGATKAYLKGDLYHYSFQNKEEHLIQNMRFAEIGSQTYFKMGRKAPIIKILISPVLRFIRDYILKVGFVDGAVGYQIARISAIGVFWKYRHLRRLIKSKKKAAKEKRKLGE